MARKSIKQAKKEARSASAEDQQDDQSDTSAEDDLEEARKKGVLRGGPGMDSEEDQDQDDGSGGDGDDDAAGLVEVSVGGRKYKVPAEVAESMDQASTTAGKLRRLEQEIGELRSGRAKPAAASADEDEDAELTEAERLLFTEPKKAMKLLEARAVKKAESTLTRRYVAAEAERSFWGGFNKQYPELADVEWLVRQVAEERSSDLEGLTVAEGAPKLAKWANDRLRTLVKKVDPASGGRPKTRSSVEGGGSADSGRQPARPAARREEPEKESNILSLTDILKQRRQARRQAALGKPNQRRA